MLKDRLVQLLVLAAGLAALAVAGWVQTAMETQREALKLVTVTADESIVKHPKTALLQIAPGGLRAPFLNYLWIRSQQLKQEGKLFDAKQLRDMICDLMPHSSGVWIFHAWDMAWNISVMTHTPQERWMWVHNGMRLLRDKGLYYNPDDIVIYRELAWIFFSKMGRYMDQMHLTYKRRWAGLMQHVLGAPPPSGTTEEVLDAFRPIAEAPDRLQALLSDPAAARFVTELRRNGIEPDAEFLRLYNRFSDDPLVAPFYWPRTPADNERDKALAALMNDPAQAAGRAMVLAFTRRKILREEYRMDPEWMLQLMEKYGPLDWRQVNAHAIYWATVGLNRVEGKSMGEIEPLNTGRVLLGGLKALTRTGKLYYTPNPGNPEEPFIDWQPDWRFIEPTHQAYLAGARQLVGPDGDLLAEENYFRDGHLTYLNNAILQLYIGDRAELAQHYYQVMNDLLRPEGKMYKLPLPEFIRAKFRDIGAPTSEMYRALWMGALRSAYRALAGGDLDGYRRYRAFSARTYRSFLETTGDKPRLRPPEFKKQEAAFLATFMVQPQAVGIHVPLLAKVRVYAALDMARRRELYPLVADHLRQECEQAGLDFEKAFPAPMPEPAKPEQQAAG